MSEVDIPALEKRVGEAFGKVQDLENALSALYDEFDDLAFLCVPSKKRPDYYPEMPFWTDEVAAALAQLIKATNCLRRSKKALFGAMHASEGDSVAANAN